MNAEITGEIPHIDGGQSPGHSDPCQPSDGGDGHPAQHIPAVPPLSARRCQAARAAVVSTVTLRRFRS